MFEKKIKLSTQVAFEHGLVSTWIASVSFCIERVFASIVGWNISLTQLKPIDSIATHNTGLYDLCYKTFQQFIVLKIMTKTLSCMCFSFFCIFTYM